MTCLRCGTEIEEGNYCDNCYDNLFVSWEESYKRMIESAEVIIEKGKKNDPLRNA